MTIKEIANDPRVMWMDKGADGWFVQLNDGWVADDLTSSIYAQTIKEVSAAMKLVREGDPE